MKGGKSINSKWNQLLNILYLVAVKRTTFCPLPHINGENHFINLPLRLIFPLTFKHDLAIIILTYAVN